MPPLKSLNITSLISDQISPYVTRDYIHYISWKEKVLRPHLMNVGKTIPAMVSWLDGWLVRCSTRSDCRDRADMRKYKMFDTFYYMSLF